MELKNAVVTDVNEKSDEQVPVVNDLVDYSFNHLIIDKFELNRFGIGSDFEYSDQTIEKLDSILANILREVEFINKKKVILCK